ncbi:hypothetical protein BJX76DRAFT_195765 [Aspergillus varians]
MKTTFAALALSLLGTTLAIPTPQATSDPNPYPVSVGGLSMKHLIESDTYDFTFEATRRSSSGEALETVTCHTSLINGAPFPDPTSPVACSSTYTFYFPSGAADVESFELALSGPDGDASGLIAVGPKYLCGPYMGDIGNIDTECRSANGGEFYLKV